ncbi:MAG: response regulator [Lachnospiraceae bacterium]|nr:response regulator [Lachnospiraceae bacterium]
MVSFFGEDNILKVAFSIAALVFGIVLYILICALRNERVNRDLKFRTLVFSVVLGDIFIIFDILVRKSGKFDLPPAICILLVMIGYEANVLLTFFMSQYISGFFTDHFTHKGFFEQFNRRLVIASLILNVVFIVYKLFIYQGPDDPAQMPFYVKIIMGYAFELYYLIYAVCLFAILGKHLSKRARRTGILALAVTTLGVVMAFINAVTNGPGINYNYFAAVMGLYIFYIGVETPDYKKLMRSVKELEAARMAADEANMAKSVFLANMSHEIRTPINAVIGMNEMILRESSEDAILGYAGDIDGAGKNLLSIINDILDLSKIEAGKMEIVNDKYSLKSLINDVVNMISFKCREKDLDFQVDLDPSLPDGLSGDEVRIRQIIINILNNAVKYTKKGSVRFTTSGERRGDDLDLAISVKDTGIGIKKEDLDKIFGKFDRVDTDKTKSIEGTGLGLAITDGLLKAMNGHVHVDSEYGVGSEFLIHIPQKVVDDTPVGKPNDVNRKTKEAAGRYHESFRAPNACILHVDDTAVNHTVMKGLLKKTGVKIDMAMNGPESVAMAEEKKYDLIFMDYRMPHMDGVEALRTIKSNDEGTNAHTPVICLTADAVSGARDRYLAEGFDDYLAKPVDPVLLEEIMVRYLPEEKIERT